MSLKDLLPEGSYDEIVAEAHTDEQALKQESATLMVTCPTCKKRIPYDRSNPFRPFCSERCKLRRLGQRRAHHCRTSGQRGRRRRPTPRP